jgi:hypothetical protein
MHRSDESEPPLKRARSEKTNGGMSSPPLQPLSLSILGVEPIDEFIKEIADFVHYTILNRPDLPGAKVEVEAKIGLLRDRGSGERLALPVLVESSELVCTLPSSFPP